MPASVQQLCPCHVTWVERMQFDVMGVSKRSMQCSAAQSCTVTFPVILCVFIAVLAEELAKGDGSFQASLRCMLLDGSLHEVAGLLSKSLFGEPLVRLAPGLTPLLTLPLQHLHLFHPPNSSPPPISPSYFSPLPFLLLFHIPLFLLLPFSFSSSSPFLFSLHLLFPPPSYNWSMETHSHLALGAAGTF